MQKQTELFPYITKSPKESKKLAQEFVVNNFDILVERALSKHDSFVYEGHFTNDSTWLAPKRFNLNLTSISYLSDTTYKHEYILYM